MTLSLSDIDLTNKCVLMRVDFNVPINKEGSITSDVRIQSSLQSIHYILKQPGARLILMSHLGRPNGKPSPSLSLSSVAKHLQLISNYPVTLAPDCIGDTVESLAQDLQPGHILLLENLRFHPEEEKPDNSHHFAQQLARLGDVYINDAFGSSHRNHSSVAIVPKYFKDQSGMGFLMENEVHMLSSLLTNPKRPFAAIVGGAKVSSKLGVLHSLSDTINIIFIGGAMAFTFFKALGYEIGDSLCEEALVDDALVFLESCKKHSITVYLPEDIIATNGDMIITVSPKDGIRPQWKGMDIGPATIKAWSHHLSSCQTIFWNGPMGVFEVPAFAHGTRGIAKSLSKLPAKTIVGGGDSIAAITDSGLKKHFTHLSTGGGASLEFIEHKTLPGIQSLFN